MTGKEILVLWENINLGDRFRTTYKDIQSLAEDIHQNGIIHPMVVDENMNLRVGGRRYHAYEWLREQYPKAYDLVQVRQIAKLTHLQERVIELSENLNRSDMTWKEKCIGVAEVHRLSEQEANRQGLGWVQQQTASELGVSQTNVSFNLQIAKSLVSDPDGKIAEQPTLSDAIKFVIGLKNDEVNKERLIRAKEKRKQITEATPLPTAEDLTDLLDLEDIEGRSGELISYDTICAMLHHGDALQVLSEIAKGTEIHHIITDPPYGVDPAQMETIQGIDRVAEEHQVRQNLELIENFLEVAYQVIHEAGFMCMWYDLDHHEKIMTWARKIGWKVQRWPFIWVKPTSGNNMAQYNLTKCTEYCMFFRRSEKSVLMQRNVKNWIECPLALSKTHPFYKGGLLWETLIDAVSTEGQTIVDPFCGEGSALIPIFYKNRNPIGIELVEKHIASAAQRMYAALNKTWMWEGRKDERNDT